MKPYKVRKSKIDNLGLYASKDIKRYENYRIQRKDNHKKRGRGKSKVR